MSAPGRPKRECRSAQHEGSPGSVPGNVRTTLGPAVRSPRSAGQSGGRGVADLMDRLLLPAP